MKMNEVIKNMLERSSIRAYENTPISGDEILQLKKAALSAPTAMNRNEQRFLFITDTNVISFIEERIIETIKDSGNTDMIERINSRNGKVLYDAPLFIGIFGKDGKFTDVDAGIAVQNLALAAKSMGLDSVILGMPLMAFEGKHGDEIRAKLNVPSDFNLKIAIAIGHAAMDKKPHEWDESHIIEI